MEQIKIYIDYIAKAVEFIGVLTLLAGTIYSLSSFIASYRKSENAYIKLRQTLGKSILIGLEILIAADIISTVVTEATLRSVAILGLIVIIRTFLSLSLQVELEGKFPWQKIRNQKK